MELFAMYNTSQAPKSWLTNCPTLGFNSFMLNNSNQLAPAIVDVNTIEYYMCILQNISLSLLDEDILKSLVLKKYHCQKKPWNTRKKSFRNK